MKKKTLALLLALSLSLLTACGASQSAAANVDLNAFYTDVQENHELPALMDLDEETIEALYPGLLDLELKQRLVSTAAISSAAGELVLVETAKTADADAVKDILQARIDYQVGDSTNPGGAFYPETIRQWEENSRIAVSGNYVMLVVGEEADGIVEDFNGLFR